MQKHFNPTFNKIIKFNYTALKNQIGITDFSTNSPESKIFLNVL